MPARNPSFEIKQPSVVMAKADNLTLEHFLEMFRHLTGKEPTAAEIDDLRQQMEADAKADAAQS